MTVTPSNNQDHKKSDDINASANSVDRTKNITRSVNETELDSVKMNEHLPDQVIELQMSMAHLELTVERLDQVVTRQDQHIQTLQRQLQLIYKQVESQDGESGIAPFDVMADRPPHY